jgi:hypothetical protein
MPYADPAIRRAKARAYVAAYRERHPDRVKAARRKHYMANPERFAHRGRRRKLRTYGLTIEQYDALWIEQLGLCAICRQPETTQRKGFVMELAVDHCHTTGKVRGLLCSTCNLALGQFADDASRLRAAAMYLVTG